MADLGYGRRRQREIYLAGLRGHKPRVSQNAVALERAAERAMTREGFAYIAGGAGLETTMRANREAFERVRIVPRMLRGTESRDLTVELFGRTLSAPFLLAPIGVLEMAHRDADLAVARSLWRVSRTYPGLVWHNLRSARPRQAAMTFVETFTRPTLNWDDVAFVREATRLPLLLKGILDPDDARTALDHGIDGIIVSNHGGRQVDGAIASLDALPAVVSAVRETVPVLFDSGVRGGADVFKALALGAQAVLIGRPYCYGLAVAGEAGVREVIRNFFADIDLTLALTGCAGLTDIGSESVSFAHS